MSDMTCRELVELVTAFLDGLLDAGAERRFVDHLAICDGCGRYLDQVRQTVCSLGDLPPDEPLPGEVRKALLDAFRDWST
jgi:hypothetical protein